MTTKARTLLTSKGQVFIPEPLRERLRWMPGAELKVEIVGGDAVHLTLLAAEPQADARVWYHGTFDARWAGQSEIDLELPTLTRLRRGDWYVLVYWRDGRRVAQVPRRVRRVHPRDSDRKVKVILGEPLSGATDRDAAEIEEGIVPKIRYRWVLLSDRLSVASLVSRFRR